MDATPKSSGKQIVIARPIREQSSNNSGKPTGFVVDGSLREESRVAYQPSKHDPVFSENTCGVKSSGYELTEEDLLVNLKSQGNPLHVKECKEFWVSEGLGRDYASWSSDTPVFISAQTGRGKNTFIKNDLIPFVKENNYRNNTKNEILVLSNRIALNVQEKKRIEKSGVAKVLLYQSLLSFANSHKILDKYKYLICDECHFFTADSSFNPNTALILDKIVRSFQHSVRIYMSSTFTDCLHYIFDYERRIYGACHPRPLPKKKSMVLPPYDLRFKYFLFKRDYSYLNINYYCEHLDLRDTIIESVREDEKWLIFIDDIKKCEELKEDLLGFYKWKYGMLNSDDAFVSDEDIKLIDAGSKKDQEYMQSIVDEKFVCKILISTSVIDNGINLKDSSLKHIVVSDLSKCKCLQMVGRKRIEPDDSVNLYIKVFDAQYMEERIVALEAQRESYALFNRAYNNSYDTENSDWEILAAKKEFLRKYYNDAISDFEDAKHWFYRDEKEPELVHPNEIAVLFLDEILLPRYNFVLERMKETGSGQEFLEHQLSWFGKTYEKSDNITTQILISASDDFTEFANGLNGKTISKDDQESFGIIFFEKHSKAFGLRRTEDGFKGNDNKSRCEKEGYGKNIINEVFTVRGIGLIIESNKDGDWVIKSKT